MESLPNGIHTTPGTPGRQVANDQVEASRAKLRFGQSAPKAVRPLTRVTRPQWRDKSRSEPDLPNQSHGTPGCRRGWHDRFGWRIQACCKRLPRHRLYSRRRLIPRCSIINGGDQRGVSFLLVISLSVGSPRTLRTGQGIAKGAGGGPSPQAGSERRVGVAAQAPDQVAIVLDIEHRQRLHGPEHQHLVAPEVGSQEDLAAIRALTVAQGSSPPALDVRFVSS